MLLENYITNESSLEMLGRPSPDFRKRHEYYRANLVESLGDAIRKSNETLVRQLDAFLAGKVQTNQ